MKFLRVLSKGNFKAGLTNTAISVFLMLALTACTTSKAIRTPVLDSPTVEQARVNRDKAKLIRWGGLIVSVENKSDHTLIEIVERPLTRNGKPKTTNKSGGRFLAKSHQFIDPENIKTDQAITVNGTLVDYTTGMIGEYEYLYPVVDINEYKIWPASYRRDYYGYPYWYDPYWGPYPYWYRGRYLRYRHW